MKICFITEDFYPNFIGGQGVWGYHLISGLAKKRNNVVVIVENRGKRKKFWRDTKNVELLLTPFCFGNQIILSALEYVVFRIYCGRKQFDILHASQLSALFFVLFRPKNIKKIVVSVHNTNFDMYQVEGSWLKRLLYLPLIWLERIVYTKADALIFNSPLEEKDLKKYYVIKNKPTKSIYLGAEKSTFTSDDRERVRMEIRKKLGLSVDAKIILYVGRIVKRKKVSTLIKAMSQLDKSLQCVIVGDGVERKKLEQVATNNVQFLGYIDDTKPYFLAADLFVLTSVAEGGIALSALEAASYSLPLILSPSVAGCPLIRDGQNGFIVNSDDSKNLTKKIKEALENSAAMRKKSQELARYFSWKRCVNETLAFYQLLLEKL